MNAIEHTQGGPTPEEQEAEIWKAFMIRLFQQEKQAMKAFESFSVAKGVVVLALGGDELAQAALAQPRVARRLLNRPALTRLFKIGSHLTQTDPVL